ncbi:DMT family transporter [Alphaproteobacteria bacterium KMM 3653]|uniref:DMT family transporter n=1 Tax=Harenicola maris TaxID=2841044 RepID=A0AAP2G431_9RHOB|nr:DMT family transporter [Harenicola maris]
MQAKEIAQVAGLVVSAVSIIVVGDTAGKVLTQGGVSPFFVAWTRFAIAAVVLLPFSGLVREELRALRDWRVLLRAMFISGGICSILTALSTEPIANVFGAFFIGPIVSYLLAVVLLGERPSSARWGLLALGFCGVMLVVKPGFGATPGIGFALLAGVFYGCFLTISRAVAVVYRPRLLLISQLVLGALLLTPFGLSVPMPEWSGWTLPLVVLSAVASAVGNFLLVLAHRRAEASLIAPLVYAQLFSATLLGIFVFGEWPDAVALGGLVLIAASGLGSLWLVRDRVSG